MTTLTVDVGDAGKAVLTATPAAGDEAGLLVLAAQDNAGRLRHFLASVATWHAEAQQERDGGWVLHIPGTGLAASGETFDAAIDDLIGELRQYADGWAPKRDARGRSGAGDHMRYRLELPDGRVLNTKISRPVDRTVYGEDLW